MTAFLGITDAIKAALIAAPALAGGRVHRGRHVVLQQGAASLIELSSLQHQGEPLALDGTALQWQTAVPIVIKARASAGVDAEAALDPLISAVWQRLAAITVPAGVRGIALDPVITIDFEEAENTVATAALTLRITHVTTTAALGA